LLQIQNAEYVVGIFVVHKSKIFILFILFSLCTPSESIENSATSTTEFIGVETTTSSTSSTTTVISGEAKDLNIEITNCPQEVVDIEVGETYKVDFFVLAGSSDVTSIFYYFELNGEYYSRLPLDKENHSEFFDFPLANQLTESATFVEKFTDGDVYYIYIDVIDDELNSVSTECEVKF